MRRYTITAAMLAALSFAATDYASAAPRGTKQATGAIRGTKEKITFEIVRKKQAEPIPNGYDGFNWHNVNVNGEYFLSGGAAKVVHGKVVAIVMQGQGIMSPVSGSFWLKSGHFAATCTGPTDATFSAYRRGVLIGQLSLTLQPADTKLRFDRTFSRADQLVIQGSDDQNCGNDIAMDNLEVVLQ